MITFTTGNLLKSDAEALVNTVNTVGVMGKGIALMFKEAFPDNFSAYVAACKAHSFNVGELLVTRRERLGGPRWIVNFPTKKHWRNPSKLEWIQAGLAELRKFLVENEVKSVAIPPLGSGNGGLDWRDVKPLVIEALGDLAGVDVHVFEPTSEYQNVAKRRGVEKLTPARALVAELVRRYSILGIDCSILEIQKLAYFLERQIALAGNLPGLELRFKANRYGPYADRLQHLLDSLDGSYLHCERRIADASPFEPIRFDDSKRDLVAAYLTHPDARAYREVLDRVSDMIDGFESPVGLELLATVDWLLSSDNVEPKIDSIKQGLREWSGGADAGARKLKLFDDQMIEIAISQLTHAS